MFKSIYSKLATLLLGLFFIVGLSLVVLTFFSTKMYQQEVNQKLNRGLAANIVSQTKLKRLAAAMEAFKKGEIANQIKLPINKRKYATDEIDRLTITFLEMAQQIEAQIKKLHTSDSLRRELVANVSHDLRTPLATLQGYIETLLLKDNNLSAEERQRYLEIAIKHCVRLSNLVTELFELAKLDSNETKVKIKAFNLNELIQDVVQKFQLKAKEKDIHINAKVEKNIPFVYADIALIERVLENLLENALRYTPPDGSISIMLIPEKEGATIQVGDTGYGIPNEELPYIFDRFYRQDKSRDSKSGYAGLGLAITKRILELHNRTIVVDSTINKGTTSPFHLPVSSLS